MTKSILITGAGGFIGSFLVEKALNDGWEVWAGIRSTTSRQWLTDRRIHFIDLPYQNRSALAATLLAHRQEHGAWEVVINNMGVTKCKHPDDFERVNCEYVQHLVEALRSSAMLPQKFVLMSSLSAFGPTRDGDMLPIRLTDAPCPNTAYGRSKLHVAQFVKAQSDLPYLIFYPTGVYGPREKDYYLMFKTVRAGIDFVPGLAPQRLTFIYVRDLADCIFAALYKGVTRREYIVAEGRSYASSDFRRYIQQAFGIRYVWQIRVPLSLLKAINYGAGWIGNLTGKTSTLNADKYKIMAQRNWDCDITPLHDELDFTPAYSLEQGVNETFRWYKKAGWL